jgi:hypothetical protein
LQLDTKPVTHFTFVTADQVRPSVRRLALGVWRQR